HLRHQELIALRAGVHRCEPPRDLGRYSPHDMRPHESPLSWKYASPSARKMLNDNSPSRRLTLLIITRPAPGAETFAMPRMTDNTIGADYAAVRQLTANLCAPLSAEDMLVQSMPSASPTKWHLAHTTWFFEAFILVPHLPGYRAFDERFGYLF